MLNLAHWLMRRCPAHSCGERKAGDGEQWGSGACTPLSGSTSLGQVGWSAHFRKLCLLLTAPLSSWGVCLGFGKPSKQLCWFLQTVLSQLCVQEHHPVWLKWAPPAAAWTAILSPWVDASQECNPAQGGKPAELCSWEITMNHLKQVYFHKQAFFPYSCQREFCFRGFHTLVRHYQRILSVCLETAWSVGLFPAPYSALILLSLAHRKQDTWNHC